MVWGWMSTHGVAQIHFTDGTMDADMVSQNFKCEDDPSLKCLGRGAIFQHDNDPKDSAKMTSAFLKKKVKVLDWSSMSPDLNPIEHL